jgi:hypothetical protein
MHVLNTDCTRVCLKLWSWKRIHQWISNIEVRVHFANLHITSINNLVNKVIAPKYMFGFLVRSRLLGLCNGTIIIKKRSKGFGALGTTPNSETNFLIQIASLAGFYRRIIHHFLLGTFPTYCSSIEAKHNSGL